MYKETFEIVITTNNKLTNLELNEIKHDIYARLQGYSTICPKSIKNADMELKYAPNIRKLRKEKLNGINTRND